MKLIFCLLGSLVAVGNGIAKEDAPAKSTKPAVREAAAKPNEVSKADSEHAEKQLSTLDAAQKRKLLNLLNKGDDKALGALPGVGAAKAEAIKKARPFKSAAELIGVGGFGRATFDEVVKWVAAGGGEQEKPGKAAPGKQERKPAKKKEEATDKTPAEKKGPAERSPKKD